MKGAKKMKGFMCQSPSSTAVCMASETLSVIVPRRSSNGAKSMNNSKYIRLGEQHKRNVSSDSVTKPSLSFPLKIDEEKQSQDLAAKDQVVVMRVSIHCQGCAGKIRKHLSKMEGVTSFSVELESKRVIVRGHVSR